MRREEPLSLRDETKASDSAGPDHTAAQASYWVGDIEVVTVPDGQRTFPLPHDFILNASRSEINTALVEADMKPDEMTIVFNPILIRTGGKQILIDTGNGVAAAGQSPAGPGLLMESLAAAGVAASEIDLVVISHFHSDHINGLLLPDGSLAFPNAGITVPEPEWDFWTSEEQFARAPAGRMRALFENVLRVFASAQERTERHAWGKDVSAGITSVGTPGHSIGHTSYIISSGNAKLFVQSDVTNHPALFVSHPEWHAVFDHDPEKAEITRRKVYDMLVAEDMPVQGFHFPLPSCGRVERTKSGYRINRID
jgi:glyoxylase-like metal-dependent hydrolase (beta-lactamase superfamily II)